MNNRASLLICVVVSAAVAAGCYAHTDFVVVEPVRYVPPPTAPVSNARFGWVRTTPENAERFKVRVGDLTYERIIEPHKKSGTVTLEDATSAFSAFAEAEVVRQKFCPAASTPADARRLIGSNTPPEMWIYVQCMQ
jgi:hypothetical protein